MMIDAKQTAIGVRNADRGFFHSVVSLARVRASRIARFAAYLLGRFRRLNQAEPLLTLSFRPLLMGGRSIDCAFSFPAPHGASRLFKYSSSGIRMNKTELIDHIAQQADLSKAAAGRALDALIGGVKGALKKGGTVTLVGFGTFAVGKRTARTGRNPRTGAAIKIKAAKVPKFKPGKALKDALN
jgi:DNA-binding protein HU-beta